jgi:nitrogen-specific signal transduction histidine kinase
MVTTASAGTFLPLGDFLTAEEPVWVWDAGARRILWANRAGQHFWGATSLEALRFKRFSAKSKSVETLTSLAKQPGVKETVETLTLQTASGRASLKCYIQGLLVAGGRPGFIVKALDYPNLRDSSPPLVPDQKKKSTERSKQNKNRDGRAKSDLAVLDAIAVRVKTDKTAPKRHARTHQSAPNVSAIEPIGTDTLALQMRELSHEIRNPLTVILGFADRIKDLAASGKSHVQLIDYAEDIMESARLAIAILSDFTFRIGAPDDRPVQAELADFRAAIDSSTRLIAPLAKGAGIKVYKRADKELPRLLITDRMLKQILLNLLMNAVRHQKTGGRIKVSARGRKDNSIRLVVADDGRGMTKKEIGNAMASPQQKRRPASGSSGLGLPLVKRLVESAGGQISIESKRGKGTKVQIVFPAAA